MPALYWGDAGASTGVRYSPDWEQSCSPVLVLLSRLESPLAVYDSFQFPY